MVKAILEGRKTQTRRVMKPQPPASATFEPPAKDKYFHRELCDGKLIELWGCPYGQPGERLWVRESIHIDDYQYSEREPLPKTRPADIDDESIYYRADGECCQQIPECACAEVGKTKWRSPIFMPRWASRITLEITNVRVERLQDISEEDAIAEGIQPTIYTQEDVDEIIATESPESEARQLIEILGPGQITAKFNYQILWDTINAKRGYPWSSNPFVWVITFKKL